MHFPERLLLNVIQYDELPGNKNCTLVIFIAPRSLFAQLGSSIANFIGIASQGSVFRSCGHSCTWAIFEAILIVISILVKTSPKRHTNNTARQTGFFFIYLHLDHLLQSGYPGDESQHCFAWHRQIPAALTPFLVNLFLRL